MLARKAAKLERRDDIDTLWQEMVKTLKAEGFEQVIYLTVDGDFDNPFIRVTQPGIYAGWPAAEDPFLIHCCGSYDIARTGVEHLDLHPYLEDEHRTFIREAGDLGFRTGLGIPMRLQGSTRFGGFNLGTTLDRDAFDQAIAPRMEELRAYCLLAHRRIEELSEARPSATDDFRSSLVTPRNERFATLSPREGEVVYLLAQGLTRKEVARECVISVHTVSDYAKSAYAKLGVRNAAQAARLIFGGD